MKIIDIMKSITFCPVSGTAPFTTDSYLRSLETEGEIPPNFEYRR